MLPFIQVGPASVRLPGLVLLAGLWIALELASREALRRGIDGDRMFTLGFTAVFSGIAGARLAFVVLNIGLYTRITPWTRAVLAVFAIAPGTEYVLAGVITAVVGVAVLIRRWKLAPLVIADVFAPAAAIFAAAVGLAAFLSGEMFGVEANLPWAVYLWGAKRHPTQIYFTIAALVGLVVVFRMRRNAVVADQSPGDRRQPGTLMHVLLVILSAGILVIEPFRADSPVIGDGVRVWSVIALAVLIILLGVSAYYAPANASDNTAT